MTLATRGRRALLCEMSAAEAELNSVLQELGERKHKTVFGWPERKKHQQARIALLRRAALDGHAEVLR